MNPRIHEPKNANRAATAILARVGVPAFCLATLCIACGHEPSGNGDDPGSPYLGQFLALEGGWRVVGTDVAYDEPSMPQVAIGLENTRLELDFLSDGPIANTGSYAAVYKTSIYGCDTSSPSFGDGLATIGLAQQPDPVVVFDLGGVYYRPAEHVTVKIGRYVPDGDVAAGSAPGNSARYAFAVYGGMQLVSVPVDQPGVDDDGDGQIDEPGEFTLFDQIAPGAVLLASGQLTLTFAR